jgi:hypothetical protein
MMRKSLSLVLIIFLSLSFLAAPGFSYSDCGENCCCSSNMTAMQHNTNHQAVFKGNCCPEVAALPCGLKKSNDFEFPMCAVSNARAEANGFANAVAYIKAPFHSNIGFTYNRVWLSADTFMQSSPIYLQHLSLLI